MDDGPDQKWGKKAEQGREECPTPGWLLSLHPASTVSPSQSASATLGQILPQRGTNSGRRIASQALPQHFVTCQGPNLGHFYSLPLTTPLCIPPLEIRIFSVSLRCIRSQGSAKQLLWPGRCTMPHPPLGLCLHVHAKILLI